MRTIKFRAWDNIRKEWLLGYEKTNLGGFSLLGETVLLGEWSNVLSSMVNGYFGERGEELKVMQFTGLLDKNGKEIYEGDIVKNEFRIWEVKYEFNQFTPFDEYNMVYPQDLEIIGNIYENPELLDSSDMK